MDEFENHVDQPTDPITPIPAPPGQMAGPPPVEDLPDMILAELPPSAPYPVPHCLKQFHQALHEESGASVAAVGSSLLASASLLAAADYTVAWPYAHRETPLSLFVLHLAGSGGRKSSAWSCGFGGHHLADIQIIAQWKLAKAEADALANETRKKKGSTSSAPLPSRWSPVALRGNSTTQALMQRLAGGRRTQGLVSDEAGAVIGGGWSMSSEQRVATLADYTAIWSSGSLSMDRVRGDTEISVSGIGLVIAWATQPEIGEPFIISNEAALGFSGRCLLSVDDGIVDFDPVTYAWPEGQSAFQVASDWTNLVVEVRSGQDSHLAEEQARDRTAIHFEEEARAEAMDFARAAHQRIGTDVDLDPHERAFCARSGENMARIAAILAAFQAYQQGRNQGPIIGVDEVRDAIRVVDWHFSELLRLGLRAQATRDAHAEKWVADQLVRMTQIVTRTGEPKFGTGGGWRINTWLAGYASGHARYLRGDPESRTRIIGLLVDHGYLGVISRGVWAIHPKLVG